MALSVFDDPSRRPGDDELKAVLGRAGDRWDELIEELSRVFVPLTSQWGFAGSNWGWSLRLAQRRRTILYLTPQQRRFLAGFALGGRAMRAAHEVPLDPTVLGQIDTAPQYAEGRGVRIEVRTKSDVARVMQLAAVKMAH